jgi:hypothetical protein
MENSKNQPTQITITVSQQLMLLPFELMRQHLEDVILQQLEIATGLYFKQADEFKNVFTTYVDQKHR